MSMSTYDFQTDSIKRGLDGDRSGRPNAHDLMSDIADTFGMEVIMVKVEAFTGDAYFAKIIMRQGDRVLNLDSKPSDAIALAVRAGAPIYVKDTMLKQLGEEVC
ncbi:MAG: bifunctional nuclease family protein [Candidatus Aenigmarchaeota archaeon]|nr:bifunctional nuclease family protein [Candidatus Aenigmarchaeota archaeon]